MKKKSEDENEWTLPEKDDQNRKKNEDLNSDNL